MDMTERNLLQTRLEQEVEWLDELATDLVDMAADLADTDESTPAGQLAARVVKHRDWLKDTLRREAAP
jgi:hypothetical protein